MAIPPDDLEQKVNSLLEKIQLTEENQQLKGKVVQLEKKLRPFLKLGEEKTSSALNKYSTIAGIVVSVGFFAAVCYNAHHNPLRSYRDQAAKLQKKESDVDVPYPRPADYDPIDEFSGHYDKVREELEEAIRLNPNNADAYWRRGKLYASFGKYGKAIGDFSKAIELNPNNGDYWYSRATARCYLGDEDATTNDINTLAVLGSTCTTPQLDSRIQLGKCFFLQGEYGLAEEFGYSGEEQEE